VAVVGRKYAVLREEAKNGNDSLTAVVTVEEEAEDVSYMVE